MIPPGFLLYTQFAGLSLFSKEKTSNNLKFINFLEKLVQKYDKIFSDIPVILSVGRRRENDGRTEMAERNRGMENFVQLKNVSKVYKMGEVEIRAVDGIEFSISKGEFVVIVGPSGAGKTTVLNILGGMDTATKGQVLVDGDDIAKYSPRKLTGYRRDDIGFVFQFYNLMPNLTALENVELARQVCKDALDPKTVMEQVGLSQRMNNFPAQLSGGEQQRVSIARALCKNPALLLCDEPTGALDSKTGVQVLSLLTDVCRTHNATVVIITHNAMIAPLGNRVIRVKNGGIESIETCEHPARVEDIAW